MKSKKRIRSIAWLLCLVLIASLFPLTAQASLSEPTATDVTIAQVESPYYAHFPDIVNVPASVYGGAYPNGKLLVAYYKNVTHAPSSSAQPFGVIQIVESTDNGQTWSEPRDVMTPEKLVELGICTADKQVESRDPNFAILSDGTLLLTFFTRRYGTDDYIKAYIMESTDGGDTWGTPVLIPCAMPSGAISLCLTTIRF